MPGDLLVKSWFCWTRKAIEGEARAEHKFEQRLSRSWSLGEKLRQVTSPRARLERSLQFLFPSSLPNLVFSSHPSPSASLVGGKDLLKVWLSRGF